MKKRVSIKKWVALLCLSIFLGLGTQPLSAAADDRDDKADGQNKMSAFLNHDEISALRPFQVQVMISGGGSRSDRSFNPGAGIHLGYQFSELMYLGLTSQTFYNDDINFHKDHNLRYDDETVYGQEGARKTTVRTDPRHLLEMRFFPWRFGLYFSAGLMHYGYQKTVTEFKSRPRIINENEYDTGITTTLEYQAWSGVETGVGFNHLFANGFSIGCGFNFGLAVQTPEVTIESDVALSATDLAEWKEQIEANEQRVPVMFQFGVGYAF